MTIYLYSGTPGSGKSLHAAHDIRQRLNDRRLRPVVGNFPIDTTGQKLRHPELYTYVPNEQLSAAYLERFADDWWMEHPNAYGEDRILLVVDECQLLFNSREWSSRDRMSFIQFFSQHRKMGYMCILVAQSPKMVDTQFRNCFEYQIDHRKVATAGIAGSLLALPFAGRLFVQVCYYYQMSERLSADWYVARKKDMALFDTNARFERR